jgi:hypothetical protein
LNIDLACRLFQEIREFFERLKKENLLERIARQDHNKSQVEQYGRLLDEAMSHFSVRVSLNINLPSALKFRYEDQPGTKHTSFTSGSRCRRPEETRRFSGRLADERI